MSQIISHYNTTYEFIKEVEKNRFLYDKTEKGFKNLELKENTWRELGEMFGLSGHECHKKWKNLKDRYVRLRNTVIKAKLRGVAQEHLPKTMWPYYDVLDNILGNITEASFFRNVTINEFISDTEPGEEVMASRILINFSRNSEESEEVLPDVIKDEDISQECNENENTRTSTLSSHSDSMMSQSSSQCPPGTSEFPYQIAKKRKIDDSDKNGEDAIAESSVLQTLLSENNSRSEWTSDSKYESDAKDVTDCNDAAEPKDQIFYFVRYLECRLRALNKKNQLDAMHQIESIMYEKEKS